MQGEPALHSFSERLSSRIRTTLDVIDLPSFRCSKGGLFPLTFSLQTSVQERLPLVHLNYAKIRKVVTHSTHHEMVFWILVIDGLGAIKADNQRLFVQLVAKSCLVTGYNKQD
jgi:hypothetical protein